MLRLAGVHSTCFDHKALCGVLQANLEYDWTDYPLMLSDRPGVKGAPSRTSLK